MTKEEFLILREFIYEKTGIFFPEKKAYLLENRLSGRLKALGLNSYEDYYLFLKHGGKEAKRELFELFDVVTTNETSFFRNPPQFEAFKEIIKEALSHKHTLSLRIWSAACSTGEEPYSIAIVLLELMEEMKKRVPFFVYATDISKKALLSAQAGKYPAFKMRNVDPEIKKKYFLKNGGFYEVKETVKYFVKIEFSNLVDFSDYKRFKNMDVVFCRNVLIYFDERVKKKVIEHLYECLNPNGYLILGHAEFLHNISPIFKPVLFNGAIIYKKG